MEETSPATPTEHPVLSVSGGPLDGASVALETPGCEKTLGASDDVDLVLRLDNVAPAHARLRWDHRGLVIVDLGSVGGTFANGERVQGERVLKTGDRLSLGPPGSRASVKLLVKGAVPAPGMVYESPPSETDDAVFEVVDEPPPDEPLSLQLAAVEPAVATALVVTPEPVSAPLPETPTPEPPTPSLPPRPAPPPKPAPQPERREKATYTDEAPSIAAERPREAAVVPPRIESPQVQAKPRVRAARRPLPRPVLVALATALVAGGAAVGAHFMRTPPPVLLSIAPALAEPGQTVTVLGSGFEADTARNAVRCGEAAASVASSGPDRLAFVVPPGLAPAGPVDVPVIVEARGTRSNSLFFKVHRAPRVESLAPDVALPGDEVEAKGQNLDGTPLIVAVTGVTAEVRQTSATSIRFVVPDVPLPVGRAALVSVQIRNVSARPAELLLGRLPLVLGVEPRSARAGDRVKVKGRGFSPDPKLNEVSVGTQPALVLEATPAELSVAVPGLGIGSSSDVRLSIRTEGKASSGEARLAVEQLSASTFVPRFFAAPAAGRSPEEHVLVASELGPFLVLSDKADAPSLAERAVRTAATLNGLFERAAATPLDVVLLDGPDPAVAIAGSTEPLLSPTARDAAGYEAGWEPSLKGRKATRRFVAAYWTALVSDHLSLFVARRRPHRVLELSPKGKALRQVFAEATKRAGPGGGVPVSVLRAMPQGLAQALGELAFELPDPRHPAAAAAEGLWEGTMEEPGGVSRLVQVRLRIQAGKLVGSLSTRQGAATIEIPLGDVEFEKDRVGFTLSAGGPPKRFAGTMQGDVISGTVVAGRGAGQPEGRFSLRYVE